MERQNYQRSSPISLCAAIPPHKMKIIEPQNLQRFWGRNSRRAWQFQHDTRLSLAWRLYGKRQFTSRKKNELLEKHQWCFIVGCNNSGTSLTQSILARSDNVSAFDLEGQRYTTALARANRRGHERVWTEFLDELRMTEAHSSAPFPQLLHDWHASLDQPVKKIIVEKTTANIVRMRWLQHNFRNARFIVLVRDGYAVSEGIYRKGERDISRAARHWNKVYEIAVSDAAQLDNVLFLPYEDLVSQHERACKTLADFVGIDYKNIAPENTANLAPSTKANTDFSTIKDFNLASKQRLSGEDLNLIEAEAGPMLAHFNYAR